MTPMTAEWIEKSDNDLAGAKALEALGDVAHADAVVFHCQQTVEKAMKALLTERGVVPHDLADLDVQLRGVEPAWAWDYGDLIRISAGAVVYRYPGRRATLQEARDALALSERIRNAAIALL